MNFDVVSEGPKQVEKKLSTEPLLNVDELAASLNVPKSWVYSRTRETGPGSMPCLSVGKYRRFRLPDVLEWLERQSSEVE